MKQSKPQLGVGLVCVCVAKCTGTRRPQLAACNENCAEASI